MRPEVNKIYKHFKGGYYLVCEIARHTETDEEMVIYISLNDSGVVWARPLELWEAPVYTEDGEIPRFVEVDIVEEFGGDVE